MTATVLLADDDADCLKILAMRCRSLGLRVLTASDGEDVLASAERESPDLVILDIGLPGDDGLQIAERLRRTGSKYALPLIVCSGHSDRSTVDHCHSLGARHVSKGSQTWPELRSLICHMLHLNEPPARPGFTRKGTLKLKFPGTAEKPERPAAR
jgi:DNA-binding response OmpR family regulator